MSLRLRSEQGFGLIELLMAMVMLNIGILAIVAAFNSGMFAMNRASQISTASALADSQMACHSLARLRLDQPRLDLALEVVDNTYKCDSALGASCPNSTGARFRTVCSGPPIQCNPSRSVTGADRKAYRIDTYITSVTPTGGRATKLVTVVVRKRAKALSARPFARISSTFDASTGS